MKKEDVKKEAAAFLKDGLVALVIVAVLLASIVAYTGNWPPLVVVESGSMTHPQVTGSNSGLGFIDPGDLVLVKSVGESRVVTYVGGASSVRYSILENGSYVDYLTPPRTEVHRTYGAAGDVIIYYKNGYRDSTPIIHRAMLWLEYNNTVNGFDLPELGIYGSRNNIRIYLEDVRAKSIELNLSHMHDNAFSHSMAPHSGYITLGDNNPSCDQNIAPTNPGLQDPTGKPVEPVRHEWMYGKARGEIPWFGAIKLYMGGEGTSGSAAVPSNSWRNMFLTILGIVALAISADTFAYLKKYRKLEKEQQEDVLDEEDIMPDESEEEMVFLQNPEENLENEGSTDAKLLEQDEEHEGRRLEGQNCDAPPYKKELEP